MKQLIKTLAASAVVMGMSIGDACAEKWLGAAIICQKYEDTASMAVEANLAASDFAAIKVYMKYISKGKCTTHSKCEKVIYKGRGSKKFFDKLRREGKDQIINTAKIIPISGIQLTSNGNTYYVQDGYLAKSKNKCK